MKKRRILKNKRAITFETLAKYCDCKHSTYLQTDICLNELERFSPLVCKVKYCPIWKRLRVAFCIEQVDDIPGDNLYETRVNGTGHAV